MEVVAAVLDSVLLSLVVALVAAGVGYAAGRTGSANVGVRIMSNGILAAFVVFGVAWFNSWLLLPEGDAFLPLIGVARALTFATGGYLLGWAVGN